MKKYLNSAEEVVKALKEGEKIEDEEGDSCYQIIDGFLIEKQGKLGVLLNAVMPFDIKQYRYYTEEPEQLKFEVNRAYKTRTNKKVYLYQIVKNGDYELYFVGPDGLHFWSFANGNFADNPLIEHENDIVGYWEEEK